MCVCRRTLEQNAISGTPDQKKKKKERKNNNPTHGTTPKPVLFPFSSSSIFVLSLLSCALPFLFPLQTTSVDFSIKDERQSWRRSSLLSLLRREIPYDDPIANSLRTTANPLHVMLCGWQSCLFVMLQTCRGRLLIREEWGGSCSPISKEGWLGGEFWMWRTGRRKQEKEEYAVIVVVKDRGFWFCYRSQRTVRIWTSWERGDRLPLGIFRLKPSPETKKITHHHCKNCCTLLLGLKVGEQRDEARTREGQRDERMKRPFSSLVIVGKN